MTMVYFALVLLIFMSVVFLVLAGIKIALVWKHCECLYRNKYFFVLFLLALSTEPWSGVLMLFFPIILIGFSNDEEKPANVLRPLNFTENSKKILTVFAQFYFLCCLSLAGLAEVVCVFQSPFLTLYPTLQPLFKILLFANSFLIFYFFYPLWSSNNKFLFLFLLSISLFSVIIVLLDYFSLPVENAYNYFSQSLLFLASAKAGIALSKGFEIQRGKKTC